MKTGLYICDVCRHEGNVKLAVGCYETDEGNFFDACAMHLGLVKDYPNFKTWRYECPGKIEGDLIEINIPSPRPSSSETGPPVTN